MHKGANGLGSLKLPFVVDNKEPANTKKIRVHFAVTRIFTFTAFIFANVSKKLPHSIDKTEKLCYNASREGVVSAFGVASQHPGRFGLACFQLRDSCMQRNHTWSLFLCSDPSMALP